MLAAIDHMRVAHDTAVAVLPENVRQPNNRNGFTSDDRREYVARTDRGKLVRVADKNKSGIGRHRLEQRAHERNVDHGALVENNGLALQKISGVFAEDNALLILGKFGAEEPVNRRRFASRQFGHALGGATCRCGKKCFQSKFFKQG